MRCNRTITLSMLGILPGAIGITGCDRPEPKAPATERAGPVAATAPAAADTPGSVKEAEPYALSCTFPVDGNRDTAVTVLKRFGPQARRATLPGPEGTELNGIVLWPDRPERRLELVVEDQARQRITGVLVRDARARWRWQGLGLGDSLDAVARANGKPFTFWGFGWDYGGFVSDWASGRLDDDPGGCVFSLRLESGPGLAALPDGASGDRAVRSSDPAAVEARPQVGEISLAWP